MTSDRARNSKRVNIKKILSNKKQRDSLVKNATQFILNTVVRWDRSERGCIARHALEDKEDE
jgi:hypothetical protein